MKQASAVSILAIILALTACGGGSAAPDTGSENTPAALPDTAPANSPPAILGTAPTAKENAVFRYTPSVTDPNGDAVTLSVSNLPDWLSFDVTSGEISGTPDASHVGQRAEIEITATDGSNETRLIVDIEVAYDELEQALRTGDVKVIDHEHTLSQGIAEAVESERARYSALKTRLFQLNPDGSANANSLTDVSWNPGHDAALLESRFGSNFEILTSNAVTNRSYVVQQHALGIVGETDASKYAVFGSNPMRSEYRSGADLSDDMRALVDNTLDWLTSREADSIEPLNIVIAQFDQSYHFPDQEAVRSWLDRRFGERVSYNAALECNGERLKLCVDATPDLLLISQRLFDDEDAGAIADQVLRALRAGTSVMYLHHDGNYGEIANELFPLLNVDYYGDNYWRKLTVENYNASSDAGALPVDVSATLDLVDRFSQQSFSFDLSSCENTACPSSHAYNSEFLAPVETLQGQLWSLDEQGVRLFENSTFRYQKLLVLLGDFYRQRVRYPMDRDITPTVRFLRSLYADHTTYHNRRINHAQPDMGNFSRSDFSRVTPTTQQISVTSKRTFRAAGVYALPGVPFTVSRLDSNDIDTHIFINTLRPGATHQFDQNGYSRPKYLESTRFPLDTEGSLTLTSPHGGPIQIQFSRNNVPVDLRFEQVGLHPFWASEVDDDAFVAALESGNFDWAELVTPAFEVHSTLEKMRETLTTTRWGTAARIAAATGRYVQNFPHVLAGLRGPGIDVVPEIHDFAVANGLTIHTIDEVKHMNADQATCGYGCSGNPYDAYWSFDPLGHGDLHELGHGLERSRFRFDGWDAHASTNPYSYYSKYRYYTDTGDTGVLEGCQDLPFSRLFDVAQASRSADDPSAYMQSAALTGWQDGTAIFLQLMMRVQEDNALNSGWNLLARLHVIERDFSRADDSGEDWIILRDGLGFSGMTRTEARRLSNNDWLLIALSHASGRDLRDYLTMWGLSHSDAAANHVESMRLPSLPVAFHVLDPNAYCLGLDHPSVPVDGKQTWTAGT